MSSLKDASKETLLAVDLIYLLETSDVEIETVLKALEIVKHDYLNKQQAAEATCSSSN